MNELINRDYFQIILNQFLSIDRELIPWKFVCKKCYYFPHKIHISDLNIYKNTITKLLIPVSINTKKFICYNLTMGQEICKCCLNTKITNVCRFNSFHSIKYIKELRLYYSQITNKRLSKMKSLEYLDLGTYSNITNKGLKKLKKIKVLFLGNNSYITKNIFRYLPNLHTIQIGFDIQNKSYCSICPEEIPKNISNVICNYYKKVNCRYSLNCVPLYSIELYCEHIYR